MSFDDDDGDSILLPSYGNDQQQTEYISRTDAFLYSRHGFTLNRLVLFYDLLIGCCAFT